MKLIQTLAALAAVMLAGAFSSCDIPHIPGGFTIDHTDVDAGLIPTDFVNQAKVLAVRFEHASVGENIMAGLDDLSAADSRYLPNGITDNPRGNPGLQDKVDVFNTNMRAGNYAATLDVAMFKFCFIDSQAVNNDGATAQQAFDYIRPVMEGLQTAYPNTTFVWWTMPLETTADAWKNAYNALVRNYCAANGQVLLDIAAIESHEPGGTAHLDGGAEALVDAYSTDGGHLDDAGNVGRDRVANAWWVMLARLCGWNG